MVSRDCTQIDRCSPSISEERAQVLFPPSIVDDHQNAVGRGDLPGRLGRCEGATADTSGDAAGGIFIPGGGEGNRPIGKRQRQPAAFDGGRLSAAESYAASAVAPKSFTLSMAVLVAVSPKSFTLSMAALVAVSPKSFTCSLRTWICD